MFLAARSTARSTWGHSSTFLPVVDTKVITRRLAESLPWRVAGAKRDVQHSEVKLFTLHERVDPKPPGVERFLALAAVLEAGDRER